MVAIVHNSASLRNALHYNENKVAKNVAECIHSLNFSKDTERLTIKDKFNRLYNLITLNQQTKINSVHISLNFDSSDQLNNKKLKEIAETYLQKIGFGEQPCLVYQHHDAGHPHLHIVTTNIKSDGRRIELHNLGRNLSMKASKEIEKEFHLIEALGKSCPRHQLQPVNVQKVQYGKSETKRAITNVLDAVLPHYKYASLAELNAALKLYNILADRGSEESRTYRSGGLVYRIVNEKGEKTGIPIKASLIYNKPTLSVIQARFAQNKENRQRHKQRVKMAVDLACAKQSKLTIQSLQHILKKESIDVCTRQNEAGLVYGLTYVDHQTKCVFNGSDLGRQYSANAINQRSHQKEGEAEMKQVAQKPMQQLVDSGKTTQVSTERLTNKSRHLTEDNTKDVAAELKEEQKHKRKRKQHN